MMYDLPNVPSNIDMTKAGAAVDPNNEVKLFKPITIKNITVKNRIFLAPMCMFSAGHDGKPNSMHFVHYGTLAQRGVGLIVIEATAVQDIGRITPYDLGLWNDEQTEYFKPMVNFMHYHGAVVGVQLAHAGRKASDSFPFLRRKGMSSNEEHGWPDKIVGPSAIALNEDFVKPIELSKEQIKKLVEDFGEAARRANEAGIDVIEIHAAHGYLIHQFLSPISNHRTDEYGGSFENRIRFCLEIIESVKSKWPKEKPIFVRFSATDYIENGWNVEETSKICSIIKKMGIDLVDCSSGAISPEQKLPPLVPGYQVPFAKEVKKNNPDLLVSAVGLILDGPQAEEILQNGSADVITIGRPCLRDTSTVLNWAKQLNVDVQWPTQYRVSKLSSSKKF